MSKSVAITIHKEDGSSIRHEAPYFACAGRYDDANAACYCDCSLSDILAGAAVLIANFIYDVCPTYRKRKRVALENVFVLYELIKTILKRKEQEESNE